MGSSDLLLGTLPNSYKFHVSLIYSFVSSAAKHTAPSSASKYTLRSWSRCRIYALFM